MQKKKALRFIYLSVLMNISLRGDGDAGMGKKNTWPALS